MASLPEVGNVEDNPLVHVNILHRKVKPEPKNQKHEKLFLPVSTVGLQASCLSCIQGYRCLDISVSRVTGVLSHLCPGLQVTYLNFV